MDVKKIDPWLLKTIEDAAGFPNKPYDLTRVKAITKWHNKQDSALQLWKDGNRVGDWLEIKTGAFELLGELPNLHTLIFPFSYGFRHKDYAFLANCKNLKKLDVGWTDFRDCSLLAQLPKLAYVCLPRKDCLIHTEVLDSLNIKFIEYTSNVIVEQKPAQTIQSIPGRKPYKEDIPLNALLKDFKTRTKVPAYRLWVQWGVVPNLADSKIGGLPYWDLSQPYPVDEKGQPMQLLAQINFGQADMDPPFPKTGLLQFFIARDEMFGCNFTCVPDQKNYRVVYHPQINGSVTLEQVSALGAPGLIDDYRVSPLAKELAISVQRADSFANDRSLIFEDAFCATVQAVMGVDMGKQKSYEFLDDDVYEELFESQMETEDGCMNGGHWMLGYPSFTQEDPRSEDSPFDTLLLQIDSMRTEDGDNPILWGDCGVANFFIARADLEKLDFTQVLYNWDCC
ncbi:MAG: DUF1963 domain-containing protein [Lachnospiraceae bacterium]|nr:DUF1963 domain-containing protein [Lachnospiraceae bacterium]